MIISIIAEQRSGSTNLANSFLKDKRFRVLYEPITNYKRISTKPIDLYSFEISDGDFLLIKETYNGQNTFDELFRISDKIIILHRENYYDQYRSWINARDTGNWDSNWIPTIEPSKENFDEFKKYKDGFRESFLNRKEFFTITYEDLYYKNQISRIIEYLNVKIDIQFPYGFKYRIEKEKVKKII